MRSNCKVCDCELNENTAAKAYSKHGSYRAICKKCRSVKVTQYGKDNKDKKNAYALLYIRRIGRVKEYPCETCKTPCYKKYAKAFCSDKCRFMSYVDVTNSCWLWKGVITKQGYGKLSFKGYNTDPAHRVSYKLFKGEIPEGMLVCHQCDVRNCVAPDHLWLGTHMENMIDMVEKDRQSSKLKAEDVYKIRQFMEEPADYTCNEIMQMYNITSGTLSSILHRRIWKHI